MRGYFLDCHRSVVYFLECHRSVVLPRMPSLGKRGERVPTGGRGKEKANFVVFSVFSTLPAHSGPQTTLLRRLHSCSTPSCDLAVSLPSTVVDNALKRRPAVVPPPRLANKANERRLVSRRSPGVFEGHL
jgi:hypothetical protein